MWLPRFGSTPCHLVWPFLQVGCKLLQYYIKMNNYLVFVDQMQIASSHPEWGHCCLNDWCVYTAWNWCMIKNLILPWSRSFPHWYVLVDQEGLYDQSRLKSWMLARVRRREQLDTPPGPGPNPKDLKRQEKDLSLDKKSGEKSLREVLLQENVYIVCFC